MTNEIIFIAIALLATFNVLRMATFLIGADLFDLKRHREQQVATPKRTIFLRERPLVTVLIPAHNEEKVIVRALKSVLASDYPNFNVIVIDDGSTDATYQKVRSYLNKHRITNVILVRQHNQGKGHAMNNAIKNHAEGSLILVLDADSTIAADAISKNVPYFDNKRVVATTANIKVMPDRRFLSLVQQYEYIISNRMRKTISLLNAEYVIGGVGSMFRKGILKRVGYYSNDTITEDLDLTFKIIKTGNKRNRIAYASDVYAFTEGVMTVPALIRQRYRWKYGRFQAYFKHRGLFLNRDRKYDKRLTWLMLPYTLLLDMLFFIEPIFVVSVLTLTALSGGLDSALSTYLIITGYIGLHLIADNTISRQRKSILLALSPLVYVLLYVAAIVEYAALMRCVYELPNLKNSLRTKRSAWQHVERSGKQALTTAV